MNENELIFDLIKYRAVEIHTPGCKGCAFEDSLDSPCSKGLGYTSCYDFVRKDGLDIIWKLADE